MARPGWLEIPSMQGKVPAAEWEARVDLAALYRVASHDGYQDVTLNHFTARVPGWPDRFLIKPTELMFEEVTASSLLCFTLDNKAVYDSPFSKSPASFNIHGSILNARADIGCTMHLHTNDAAAVSAHEGGLKFISQYAMRFWGKVSYHSYEGLVHGDEREECRRMVQSLGRNNVMIMHNHGTLVCGRTIGEAFLFNHFLERACQIQARAMAMGGRLIEPGASVCKEIAQGWIENRPNPGIAGDRDFEAVKRQMLRLDESFAT